MIDNQIRASTGHLGLILFQKPEDIVTGSPWADWRSWPYAAFAMDLGSDGNSGYHSLERHFGLNIDQWNDWSHGANRDYDLATK
eukprot:5287603-Lingulodinium_polyedra.AAC.1